MKVVRTIPELHQELKGKDSVGLVPTMGNLHEGHLALMDEAKENCNTLVASVFVNRLQFGPNEDFDQYPRTLAQDIEKLEKQGKVDILFAPEEKDMYPEPQTFRIQPDPALADILEGYYRPGFFEGVATVVGKLFSIVRPDIAVFGKKDYQQLQIIKKMVAQLGMPIRIIPHKLERNEETGLALSSRNRYLKGEQLDKATELYKTLRKVRSGILEGSRNIPALEDEAVKSLKEKGWEPDYVRVVRQDDLQAPTEKDLEGKTPLVILGAAKIGTTRLIDNIEI